MENFAQKLAKFTNSKYMRILTNGFIAIAAISICGSIFSLVKSFPIPAYQTFLTNSGIGDLLAIPIAVCSDVMALYVALAMGNAVGKEFGRKDTFATALIGLGAFLVLTPFTANAYSFAEDGSYTISEIANALGTGVSGALGAKGIFLAVIAGIFGSRFYIFLIDKNIKIKMPDSVPENVAGMFEMMLPGGLTFLVLLIVRWLLSLTPFGTAQNLIYTILQTPLMSIGGGLAGALVYITVAKFLWCFGVHGGMVGYSAMASIMAVANAANLSAYAAGAPAPYIEWALAIVMMDFSILPMSICMLIFAKSEQYKTMAKISLPTSLFNISEPLVFGVPLIMNPIIDIPFILLQPINMLLTLGVMKLGIIAVPTGVSVSTVLPTPIALSFMTSHWSGFVWGIILIALDIVMYIPFVKAIDKKTLADEKAAA